MSVKTNHSEKNEIAIRSLQHVIDPEIGLNIVDLGLVYQTDFDEKDKSIILTMTLTTQFCPMGESIVDAAVQALQQTFSEYQVHLNLTFEPPWEAGMITEEGIKFLNS